MKPVLHRCAFDGMIAVLRQIHFVVVSLEKASHNSGAFSLPVKRTCVTLYVVQDALL